MSITSMSDFTLKETKFYQKPTKLLIPKTAFFRLCREIALNYEPAQGMLFQQSAMLALQESSEAFIAMIFDRKIDSHIVGIR